MLLRRFECKASSRRSVTATEEIPQKFFLQSATRLVHYSAGVPESASSGYFKDVLSSDLDLLMGWQGTVMRIYRWKIPIQWTIRDWFWMSALFGVSLCWWIDSSSDYRSESWNPFQRRVLNEIGSVQERKLNETVSLLGK